MKFLEVFDKKIEIIAPLAFIILTFFYSISRTPFFDEAYAYLISNLSIGEIFQLLKIEGHPILWYLILKLTTINTSFYPYNMLIANWIISAFLIIFVWKKAPFNNLIKFLITFSCPFFNYFGVVARPYGLSVLIIFLLCHFYKSSIKNPIRYSVLICIGINITAMSAIGTCVFGFLFLYNLIKNKTKLIKPLFIMFFGIILIVFQFFNFKTLGLENDFLIHHFKEQMLNFFFISSTNGIFQNIFHFIGFILLVFLIYVLFKKSKQTLFFLFATYFLLLIFFIKIYAGGNWHYYFFFIYLIAAIWLSWEKIKENKFLYFILVLYFLFAIFPHNYFKSGYHNSINTKDYKIMLDFILGDNNFKNNSKIFCCADSFDIFYPGIIPYLKQNKIKIYDMHGVDKTSFYSMKNFYVNKKENFNANEFRKHLDETKNNYLILQGIFPASQEHIKKYFKFNNKSFIYEEGKNKITFELYASNAKLNFFVFKIICNK